MADLERLVVQIEANTENLRRELRRMERDVGASSSSFQRFSQGLDRQMGGAARSVHGLAVATGRLQVALGGLAVGFAVREFVRMADTMTVLRGRLRLVTSGTEELARVEQQLFRVAQETRASFESTIDLYARVGRSSAELGLTSERLVGVTRTINQAIQVSGASATEASAGLVQFAQGLASGALRGDELRSVLEQMPRLAQAIADGMGVTIGQLRELGTEGALNAQTVIKALEGQADIIASEFAQIPRTVGQAMTQLNNDLIRVFDQSAQTSEVMGDLVGAVDDLRLAITSPEFIGGVTGLVDVLGFLARNMELVTIAGSAFLGMRLGAAFGPWGALIGLVAGGMLGLAANIETAEGATTEYDRAVAKANKALEEANRLSGEAAEVKREEAAEHIRAALAIEQERAALLRKQEADQRAVADALARAEAEGRTQNTIGRRGTTGMVGGSAAAAAGAISDLASQAAEAEAEVARLEEALKKYEAVAKGAEAASNGAAGGAGNLAVTVDKVTEKVNDYLDQARAENRQLVLLREGRHAQAAAIEDEIAARQRVEQLQGSGRKLTDAERDAILKVIQARRELNDELEAEKRLRSARDNLTLLREEQRLLGQSEDIQAERLAGLEKELELRREGVDITSAQAQEEIRLARETAKVEAAVDRTRDAYQEMERAVEHSTDRLVDFAADSIFDRLNGENEDFWEAFEQMGKRAIAQIAAEAIIRPIIQPIVQSAVGSVPQLFGVSGGAPRGAAAGGQAIGGELSGGGGLFGGGGGISPFGALDALDFAFPGGGIGGGLPGLMNTQLFTTLPSGFIGPPAAGQVMTLGGALGGIGAGFSAGMFVNSLLGGSQVGGMVGSGVGATAGAIIGSVVPGIGTVLGGLIGGGIGGGIGGFFGGKQSVGPNGSVVIGSSLGALPDQDAMLTNRLAIAAANADNGGDLSGTRAAAQEVIDYLNQIADTYDLMVNPGRVGTNNRTIGFGKGFPGSIRSGEQLLNSLVQGGALFSDNDAINRAIQISDAESLAGNLQTVTELLVLLEEIDLDPEELTQAERAIEGINERFEELSEQAEKFGLTTEKLEEARQAAIEALTTGFDEGIQRQIDGFLDPLAQQLAALEDAQEQRLREAEVLGADLVEVERLNALERQALLERYTAQANASLEQLLSDLTTGDLGGASPLAQLSGVRASFEAAAAQALASPNDTDARDRVADLGRQLVDLSRTAFASSSAFQSDADRVRDIVATLLDAGPAGGNVAAAVNQQAAEQVALLTQLNEEVARLNRTITGQATTIAALQAQVLSLKEAA